MSRTKREIERKERKTEMKMSSPSDKTRQPILVRLCEAAFMSFDCAVDHGDIQQTPCRSQTCDGSITCVELSCPLQGLDDTTVELRSRLWNSTFIEVTCCVLMDYSVGPPDEARVSYRSKCFCSHTGLCFSFKLTYTSEGLTRASYSG